MPALSVTSNATLVAMSLQDLEGEIPKVGQLQIYRTMQRALKRLRKPGKKRLRGQKVNWDSRKQMRAFFASDGFGRGIPTKRSNEYVKAYKLVKTDNGYILGNLLPHAKFIGGGPFGGSQSRIHQDRWEIFRVVVDEETAKLPEDVLEQIMITAKTKGFA